VAADNQLTAAEQLAALAPGDEAEPCEGLAASTSDPVGVAAPRH
jgi:hypothetical protein